MTASVSKLDELRTIRELSDISQNLNGLAHRLRPVMVNGTSGQRELVATTIGDIAEQAAALSLLLAHSVCPVEPSPAPLEARIKLLRLASEPMLNEVRAAKFDAGISVELFDLLQAVLALVWASGGAKSNELTQLAKSVYSRAGWDRLFDARERVAIALVSGDGHDK